LQRAVPFSVLAPGGQSGNFWLHLRTSEENAKFEVIMAVKSQIEVFWAATPCSVASLHREDGCSTSLRNVGILPRHYMTSHLHFTLFIVKMDAAGPFETLVFYRNTTWRHTFTSPWRWRLQGLPKRWYSTATLHDVTSSLHPEDGGCKALPKRWYSTTTLHDVRAQKTLTWIWRHGLEHFGNSVWQWLQMLVCAMASNNNKLISMHFLIRFRT